MKPITSCYPYRYCSLQNKYETTLFMLSITTMFCSLQLTKHRTTMLVLPNKMLFFTQNDNRRKQGNKNGFD